MTDQNFNEITEPKTDDLINDKPKTDNVKFDELEKINAKKNELLGKLKAEKASHELSKKQIADLQKDLENLQGVKDEFFNFKKQLAWDYFIDAKIIPMCGMRDFVSYELSKNYQVIEKNGNLFIADKDGNIISNRQQLESIRNSLASYVIGSLASGAQETAKQYQERQSYSLLSHDMKIQKHQNRIKVLQNEIERENQKIKELEKQRSEDNRLPKLNFGLE